MRTGMDRSGDGVRIRTSDSTRVALVDDDRGVLRAWEQVLTSAGLLCVGAFTNPETAVREIPSLSPDVILMDIRMPGLSGIDCTRMKMPFRIRHGFTLLELLVVIAIIAVLTSLLLPAVSRAKQAAHSAVCKSNLRQYGQAVQMYLNDFHVYPPYAMRNSAAEKALWWPERLRQYTAAKPIRAIYQPASASGIELCPSYDRAAGWQTTFATGSYGYNWAGITRNLNGSDEPCGLGGDRLVRKQPRDILPDDIRLVGENEVASPSEMVLLGDSLIAGGPEGARFLGLDDLTPAYFGLCAVMLELRMGDWRSYDYDVWRYALKGITRRHVGRWNVVFCDGHVEDLRTKQLFDLRQEHILQRWNRDNLPHKDKLPTSFR